MAASTELLGTSIYEIQTSWLGPDELKKANYALRSLPKGLKFLCVIPPSESQRLWDWWEYTTQMPSTASAAKPTALVWEGGPEQGDCGQPPTDSALQAGPGVQQMS